MQQLVEALVSELAVQQVIKIPFFVLNPDVRANAGHWSMSFRAFTVQSGLVGQVHVLIDTHVHNTDAQIKDEILRQLLTGPY